jgi:putative ubiquitin-RnfH superfamily antitoxin RatB of RatAB toxin-antitoxin module
MIMSTREILNENQQHDLSDSFDNDARTALAQWQSKLHAMSLPGDNLIEENMDVDDDCADVDRKEQDSISSSNCRFLIFREIFASFTIVLPVDEQDCVHIVERPLTIDRKERRRRRKSRFSDVESDQQDNVDTDRTQQSLTGFVLNNVFSLNETRTTSSTIARVNVQSIRQMSTATIDVSYIQVTFLRKKTCVAIVFSLYQAIT